MKLRMLALAGLATVIVACGAVQTPEDDVPYTPTPTAITATATRSQITPTATYSPTSTPFTPAPAYSPTPASPIMSVYPTATIQETSTPVMPTPDDAQRPSRKRAYDIILPAIIYSGDRSKPRVALTVDDGWDSSMVVKALQVAGQYNFRMTMFPAGSKLGSQAALWKEAVSEGHELGNHTFSHPHINELTYIQFVSELERTSDALDAVLGYHYQIRLFRPPFVELQNPAIKQAVQDKGYSIAMWSVYPYQQPSTYEFVTKNAKNGDIVLLHFTSKDMDDLERIVIELQKKYELTTITGLFAR